MIVRLMLLLVLLLGGSLPLRAEVGASSWAEDQAGSVRLLSAVSATGDLTEIRLGLEFQLKEGWKIYWRTPGDAGYPPELHWDGSKNLSTAEILWPAPTRFILGDLQNYGYSGTVVLPVVATLTEAGRPLHLRLRLDYLACEHICVPMTATLSLDIPAGLAYPTNFTHVIEQFVAQVPDDNPARGLTVEKAEVVTGGAVPSLRVTVRGDDPLDGPDVFVEPDTVALFAAPQVEVQGNRAVLTLPVVDGTLKRALTDGPLTLTVTDGDRNFTTTMTPVPAVTAETPWLLMLGLAILGGFILNLMPCVLPVLSLKILGVVHYGGAARGHIRAAFLASAAGIVVSFLLLAGAALILKAAGAAVGWGIQFQNPWFLGVMVGILLLFALNLWGWFEISLPHWLMRSATSDRVPHHTLLGHFLSGAFATLLATPCSAPFLGTAVGFALARGPVEILAIFTALGLGMAIPYLLVAAWPRAAQALPKPGAWMVVLKKVLALALLGTAVWLGSILVTVLGEQSATRADNTAATDVWQPFDLSAIPGLVADGKRVFVDVTADWCITCKINKAAVLDRDTVRQLLDAPDVVRMRADWTRPDPAISHYMAEFGRYGIPFNIVYGPGAPRGLVLPELLTEQAVTDALDRAN